MKKPTNKQIVLVVGMMFFSFYGVLEVVKELGNYVIKLVGAF